MLLSLLPPSLVRAMVGAKGGNSGLEREVVGSGLSKGSVKNPSRYIEN